MTQEELKALLRYDPETGVFFWIKGRGGKSKAGSIAGRYHPSGHRIIRVKISSYYAHRLAWIYVHGSIPEGLLIDHINGVRDDNRIKNLRLATPKQNSANTTIYRKGTRLSKFLKTRENT